MASKQANLVCLSFDKLTGFNFSRRVAIRSSDDCSGIPVEKCFDPPQALHQAAPAPQM